jgi:hypothetical protein
MPSMSIRKATYEVSGNVIWVAIPRGSRAARGRELTARLAHGVAQLRREIERSRELRCELAAASAAQRYEVFRLWPLRRHAASSGHLANAQRSHLDSLLKFVSAIAHPQPSRRMLDRTESADSLAKGVRDLQFSVERAQELTRGLLGYCRPGEPAAEAPPAALRLWESQRSKTVALADGKRIENPSAG